MSGSEKRPLVPQSRFPEFQDSGEWQEKKLAELLKESRIEGSAGDTAKKITVKLWGKGVFAKQESIKGSENTRYYKRRTGQFIYSKLDFLNQAFGIIPPQLDGFESTVDLPCFDIDDKLDPVFLLEYVKREDFYKKNGEIADGGRKAKRIQPEVFLSFPIALPTKEAEQQKIAASLSSIDELITAKTRKLDILRAYKNGLMQQLFPGEGETVPRLRFQQFLGAGDWKIKQLGTVCDMQSGKFVSASEISESRAKGFYPCYGGNGLRGYTRTFNQSGRYSLIGRQGALCGNVNFVEGEFYATEHAVVTAPKPGINAHWLFYILCRLNLNRFATGQAQPGLSVEALEKVSCAVPTSEKEQQEIAAFLFSLDELIMASAHKLDALKVHKKGLIQLLFPVLDEVPA
ncbi:MAG: restriction endonuclease subunit S [Achromobacter mucicolens]|uniref:restriction endonuclease subunit S n=1 Tax=Achromobacter mucicolens TaxID=1389922 RepID=UPI003D12B719